MISMSLAVSPLPSDHPVYAFANLVEKRRDVLRFARSLPAGQRRNQLRQTASSLRTLFKKNGWLDAHTSGEIIMSESQMPTLPAPPGCPRCQAGTTIQRTARSRFGFEHLTLRCTKCGQLPYTCCRPNRRGELCQPSVKPYQVRSMWYSSLNHSHVPSVGHL